MDFSTGTSVVCWDQVGLGQIGNFSSGIEKKNILFGIGNGGEFQPQNRVIESPGISEWKELPLWKSCLCANI